MSDDSARYRRAAVRRLLAGLAVALTARDDGSMWLAAGGALRAVRSFASGGQMECYDSVAAWDDLDTALRDFDDAQIGSAEEDAAASRGTVTAVVANLADFAASAWCPQDRDGGSPRLDTCIGTIVVFGTARGVGPNVVAAMGLCQKWNIDEFIAAARTDVDGSS